MWLPVLLGIGIGLYFSLSEEPHLLTALAPAAGAIALRAVAPRRTLLLLSASALLAVTLGFALAKVRVEWVRAPVLVKQMRAVEVHGFVELVEPRSPRGERLTLRVTALGDLPADARPLRVRVTTRQATRRASGGRGRSVARNAHAALRPGAARRLRFRAPGVVPAARRGRLFVVGCKARCGRRSSAVGISAPGA